jgi:uncharacterized protein (TIGR02569 family)
MTVLIVGRLGIGSRGVSTRQLERLLAHLRPIVAVNQLIHGDLTGNVLFHPQLPPAIIDMVPYWRPAGFAAAIVVADALVWEGADDALVDELANLDDSAQLLLRALVYRLVTDLIAASDDAVRYQRAIDLASIPGNRRTRDRRFLSALTGWGSA